MSKTILNELPSLLEAGVISAETAERIRAHYAAGESREQGRLPLIFGILGAMLVGLGIILIIAHNWDDLSRSSKTFFSFLPLVCAQVLCGFVLLKKQESTVWRETAATLLFFSAGAAIALVSQTYNIPGDLKSFIRIWMLLCVPIIYIMRSSMASLLFIAGITWYACLTGYWRYGMSGAELYFLFLLAVLPWYIYLLMKKPAWNFTLFHNWLLPVSLTISLGVLVEDSWRLMFVSYMSLFALFYFFSREEIFNKHRRLGNGYALIGMAGTLGSLLFLSYDEFWESNRHFDYLSGNGAEIFSAILLTALAVFMLFRQERGKELMTINPIGFAFLVFMLFYLGRTDAFFAMVFFNVLVFSIGIYYIRKGAKQDHLGILNSGLLIISALVLCRYFDSNLSFIARGILFVGTGAGFFYTNYRMLKKRKLEREEQAI
jgi:uncharacterized membrane protein